MKTSLKIFLLVAVCAFLFSDQIHAQSLSPSSRTWTENPADIITGDPLAGWRRAGLEGYTDKNSVAQGQTITFYVSVRDDLLPTNYNVEIYRVGATDVYKTTVSGGPFTGQFFPLHDKNNQEVFPSDAGNPNKVPIEHRIGCNWPTAFSLSIPSNWPSGFYYAKLITTSTPTKYGAIPFVVKEDNPGSTANMLVVIAWNTYVAYNYFGGGSLYWWTAQFDNSEKAYIDTVSFRRPFGYHLHDCCVQSDSLGQFNQRERRFINWAESNGYTLEYCIDRDIDQDDPLTQLPLLSKYKAVLFPGHSEYWSLNIRRNTSDEVTNQQSPTFMKSGGNVVFFAANNCYWKIDYLTNGANGLRMHSKKYDLSYLWRLQPEGPEAQWLAVQFHGTNYPGPNSANIVKNQNHWIFQGTNLVNGEAFGLGNPSQGIDEVAAGEVDQTRTNISPSNQEVLAKVFIRELNDPMETHYGEVDSIFSEMAYWEDTNTNARVFSAAGLEWCNALYGTDGDKLGIMTTNILDHFSFEKYRGNIYAANLIWGNDPLETATILDGDTYILPGKTLTLTNNFTLTINPGVTLYVQGTLVIGSGVTITGGGKVVISGSGVIQASTSSSATANNNTRKIVRDAAGAYHVAFDAGGEICYEKWANNGTELIEFRRLSAGNDNNQYPSIAECSGRLYVFWQRKTGTNTYATHFRRFYDTSWEALRTINGSITSSNALVPTLAVSTPTASFEMMVVYRTNSGLRFRRSVDTLGVTWAAAADVTTNTSARNPSLIYKANDYGYFNVTWDEGSNIKHQIYYGGTTWSAATTVSNGTSGYNHQYSSYALSGNNDRHIVWQAFEAVDYQQQAIYHNKNLTNIFTVFASTNWDHLKPIGTGHTGGTLTALCYDSNNNVRKRYYNGSYWQSGSEGTVIASNSVDPSASISNPPGAIAKAVWRSSGSAPYALTLGPSGGLSKSAADENWIYQRRIVFSANDSATLALQMGIVQLLFAGGKNDQLFAFVSDQDSIKADQLANTLSLQNLPLPANTDSLAFNVIVYAQSIGPMRIDPAKPLALAFELLSAETGLPVAKIPLVALNNDGQSRHVARLVFPVQALRGKQVHLMPAVANLNLAKVNGALVHVYEVIEEGAQKVRSETSSLIAASQSASFSMRIYPNPFNPFTQIHFYLPDEGVAIVQIYDVNGRIVRALRDGFHKAGEHTVTWDGRDAHGKVAASGMYFSHVRFGEESKVAKMMLVR